MNIALRNTAIPQKEIHKPTNESVTKSLIQWIANAVKNTIERIMTYVAKILQSVILDLIRFFAK